MNARPCGDGFDPCDRRHDSKVVLNCGTGSGLALPVNSGAVAVGYYQPGLVVGTVNLDTRRLCGPTVKIDFSSMVNFRVDDSYGDFALRIVFQLSQSCDNGCKVPLGTWTYERSLNIFGGGPLAANGAANAAVGPPPMPGIDLTLDIKDPFTFTFCECHDCPGCCLYTVEVIDIQSYNVVAASITNVGINAMAVE